MRSRPYRALFRVSTSIAMLSTRPAYAAEPASIERAAVLLFSGCGVEGAPPGAVSHALSLELGAANVRLKGEAEGFGERDLLLVVRGGCEASEALTLRASLSGAQRERSLALDDVPASSRARTLALSLAELAELLLASAAPEAPAAAVESAEAPPEPAQEAATATQPEAPEQPAAPAPPATESKPPPAGRRDPSPSTIAFRDEQRNTLLTEPPHEPSRDFIGLTLTGRWFGLSQLAWGGRARVEIGRVFFGGEALYGTARSDLGEVQGLVMDGLIGVHVFSLPRSGLVSFTAGPRVGAGAVNVSGSPTEGVFSSSTFDAYLDAALVGDLRIENAEAVGLTMSVELGVARGVVALADGNRVSEFGGFFMGLSLGIAFGL